jgi:lipoprotein-releasing system permease protein
MSGSAQEQTIAVRVAGFYDPGIMAVGNKCLLVPKEITRTTQQGVQAFSPDGTPTHGIFLWHRDLDKTSLLKEEIQKRFAASGIDSYWDVTSYEEFPFAKDLFLQFQSDRTLLLLVAALLLFVACGSVVSWLILLVHEKKREIAILRAMGASAGSIAALFGLCGIIVGTLSSLLGTLLAYFTLRYIDQWVALLSTLQGRAAFNPLFFGPSLPHQLSLEALLFVLIVTPLLSLLAGSIPALQACRIHPSATLRGE